MISSGSLFTRDYLEEAITSEAVWNAADLDDIAARIGEVFANFPIERSPNEAQTESDLIWPILSALGWQFSLTQQNLTAKGRDDVPDGLLFLDEAAKTKADRHIEDWKRYEHGVAVVEAKRWRRPLDRRSGKRGETNAPSTQMLRYLRRVEDLTKGKLRWGILTNGETWRLYYQGARSVSEQFLEIDLAALFRVRGELFDADESTEAEAERQHWLKVFLLMFRREAFAHSPSDSRTFHQRALEEGRFYEERVAKNLSDMVFTRVFPTLAKSIAEQAPTESLDVVRNAALILLYRLLFLLFAEDRNLLPVRDPRYDDYSLREKVRGEIGRRKDTNDTFSTSAARYWSVVDDLSRAIDKGDTSIGLPAYNGGLFNRDATPVLANVRLPDSVMAEVIDLLSFERIDGLRRYINYRDLSVQQLGSIYERLLEFELTRDPVEGLIVRPNLFARKNSGSYYTPDELVQLVLRETLEPLISERLIAFREKVAELNTSDTDEETRLQTIRRLDPAEAILTLRVCDPAMGSGHFLVNLVDFLADTVIDAMAEATAVVEWEGVEYISPLADRIATIRSTIQANADANNWTVDKDQLDDRHIIRRMVLKRCVYGVDKNQMAVELAKVSLWLHTFTVGAPLSFLDHHLRCGDSLFGESVGRVLERLRKGRHDGFLREALAKAVGSAASMNAIEGLTDAEIAEAHRSAKMFDGIVLMTKPLDRFLSMIHAIDWLNLTEKTDRAARDHFLDGVFGDPVEISTGKLDLTLNKTAEAGRITSIIERARVLMDEERFLNWEVAFPGVWDDWEGRRSGGFDAVVGNPPWDVMEFEDVPWFEARNRDVALATSTPAREKLIKNLRDAGHPLWLEFVQANARMDDATRMARIGYEWLNTGKLNLYKLFVERSVKLVHPGGLVGLLVPSGICLDKYSAKFFSKFATAGNIKSIFDFENKKVFFEDVHASFKFCSFVMSPGRRFDDSACGFFLQSVADVNDPDRVYRLDSTDFARVNPNTGTAPTFRFRRDAKIVTDIYDRRPILNSLTVAPTGKNWPISYSQMLNMTTSSHLFRTPEQLVNDEGAYMIGAGRYRSASGDWLPLYEGKMAQAYDHRASDVVVNPENVFRPGQQETIALDEKVRPDRYPAPRFFVKNDGDWWPTTDEWIIAFKDITATTNMRTMIATILPKSGVAHTFPVLPIDKEITTDRAGIAAAVLANINSIPFDYVSRQKVPTTHFTWYVLEQIPVITADVLRGHMFGPRSAAQIVRQAVLELTYTAHDMAPFAHDMGHMGASGEVLPPFPWDEARRLRLRAKLDAVYFHLYGIFDTADRAQSRDDIAYIYSTFPIVERQEMEAHGRYLSRDLALAYCNTLAAGHPDAEPEV
ncbi:restriction endonuclease [Fertoebacter nigrum]|uniref:site-specific DNA-methyltransferase (adenine-specific) n=1 Tax=Fertoeibacter niger TaxID=2656921 RepID=A0A8X8KQ91_9RHOB|nr:restriction endonuclease [Fertoeibacter niger]NUB43807.1 restriction endonuclease [Fertoeibacter niger]